MEWRILLITIQLASFADQISLVDPKEILDIGTGIFALVLFAISCYAWFQRRQTPLVIVALAFLMFFFRTIFHVFLSSLPGQDLIDDSLVFVALALFFVAIVVRPRKDMSKDPS